MKATMATVMMGLALALLLGSASSQEQRDPLVGAGERAFVSQGCYGCHTVGKFGTPIGPDLSHVGQKFDRTYLDRWLRDPEAQRPTAHMPKLELTPADVRALAAYLSTLH